VPRRTCGFSGRLGGRLYSLGTIRSSANLAKEPAQIKPHLSFALKLMNQRVASRAKKREISEPLLTKPLVRLMVQLKPVALAAKTSLRLSRAAIAQLQPSPVARP
jgi:hypothetical protein